MRREENQINDDVPSMTKKKKNIEDHIMLKLKTQIFTFQSLRK